MLSVENFELLCAALQLRLQFLFRFWSSMGQVRLIFLNQFLQKNGSNIFNLEGFIPRLCQLAQEVGNEERAQKLRAAGLQTLSSMVFVLS